MAKNSDLKTASVLAFERKLDPSDALLSAGQWDKRGNSASWPAVQVREKSVRGTISNRLKAKDQDPAKLDASIQNPNLQRVDVATLPSDGDTVRVYLRFESWVEPGRLRRATMPTTRKNSWRPFPPMSRRRGSTTWQVAMRQISANGRFLWRNRVGAESVEVTINHIKNGAATKSWTFDALSMNMRAFDDSDALKDLASVLAAGLAGTSHVLLEIIAHVRVGQGQEVFPSQELILDRGDKKGQKSKTLYSVDGVAAMHSQKIGNALRTIDTWYPDSAELGPIAVEPYGSVTSQGKAYRQPKQNMDFYSLLDGWVLKDKVPAVDQQHFVMANLIRGGVFGASEKD